MAKRTKTLKRQIATIALCAVEANVAFLLVTATVAPIAPHTVPDVEPVASPEQVLVDAHADDCWASTDAPLADLPGAAIVRLGRGDDTRVIYTTKRRLVDAAFTEALASIGYAEDPGDDGIETVRLCVG